MKLILTRGLPASGKSTWAKENATPNTVILTKDDMRLFFKDTGSREKKVLEMRDTMTVMYLKQGKEVIWCDTNLNPIHEQKAKAICNQLGANFEIKDFNTSYKECIARDLKRTNPVGKDVIMEMWHKYYAPIKKDFNDNLRYAIIVDIDGTLAKMNGRSPYDYSRVLEDSVDEAVKTIVQQWNLLGRKIFIVSGRPDSCKEATEFWLHKNSIPYDTLLMRKEEDRRDDVIVKKEIYENNIKDGYNVLFVLDDRPRVVRMWLQEGLKVLNCQGHTDYEF